MLFSNIERTALGPKLYAEPEYDYLDRSARPEAAKVREFIEHWFGLYPVEHRDELGARMKSGEFASASFELLIHALGHSLGFDIQIHPRLPAAASRPDFLFTDSTGHSLYVEAALSSEGGKLEQAAEARKKVVLDAINTLESPNFYLGLETEGNPATPPSGRRLRADLRQWLAGLDPDATLAALAARGPSSLPRLRWHHDGWTVQFEAVPKAPESRGPGRPVIVFLGSGVQICNTWEAVRDTIVSKSKHYPGLDLPLVLAVNVQVIDFDPIEEMEALFGQEQFVVSVSDLSQPPVAQRIANGAWHGPSGPQCTRVSAAWFFCRFTPRAAASCAPIMYLNPWAKRSVPDSILVVPHRRAVDAEMRLHDGRRMSEILDLDPSWPK